jgi:hypothetical protein
MHPSGMRFYMLQQHTYIEQTPESLFLPELLWMPDITLAGKLIQGSIVGKNYIHLYINYRS